VRPWKEVLWIPTFHIFLELKCFLLLHTSLYSCLTTLFTKILAVTTFDGNRYFWLLYTGRQGSREMLQAERKKPQTPTFIWETPLHDLPIDNC
jgi:hypothetical protein